MLNTLLAHPDIEYIEEDAMVNTAAMVTQYTIYSSMLPKL